jgi:hypothetical protein
MDFRGSGGVWRLVTPEGVAVVQKQGSQRSAWDAKLFYLNTAVIPTAWWTWKNGTSPIIKARESDGIRVLEGRVKCSDPEHHGHRGHADLWRLTADTDVDQLRTDLLDAVARAGSRLVDLLEPDRYIDELLALPDKQWGHWQALVVLLAERGPSSDLDAACAGLRKASADRPLAAGHVDRLVERAMARASS